MTVLQDLKEKRQKRVRALIADDSEILDIDAAIEAIETRHSKGARIPQHIASKQTVTPKMPIDDAVIDAVRNGRRSPAKALAFIKDNLGIDTTINSVRTRLSRLKADGRIAHDGEGWILPKENAPPDEGGADTEEAQTSSNESESKGFH